MPILPGLLMIYRNHRGEVSQREITPHRVWYGSTEFHPEPGWLLDAYDFGKSAERTFALKDCDFRMVSSVSTPEDHPHAD